MDIKLMYNETIEEFTIEKTTEDVFSFSKNDILSVVKEIKKDFFEQYEGYQDEGYAFEEFKEIYFNELWYERLDTILFGFDGYFYYHTFDDEEEIFAIEDYFKPLAEKEIEAGL